MINQKIESVISSLCSNYRVVALFANFDLIFSYYYLRKNFHLTPGENKYRSVSRL